MKNRLIIRLFTVLLFGIASAGCTKEPTTCSDWKNGEITSLTVNMNRAGGDQPGDQVNTVRMFIFTTDQFGNEWGELVVNKFQMAGDPIYFKELVPVGYLHVYFVANEEEDWNLDAVRTIAELKNIRVTNCVTPPFAMFAEYKLIHVDKDEVITDLEGNVIEIGELERLTTKLSLTLIKNIASGEDDFTLSDIKAQIYRVPKHSFLGEDISYHPSTGWSYNIAINGDSQSLVSNGAYGQDFTTPGGVDKVIMPDTYIPEHILTERYDLTQCTYMIISGKCTFSDGRNYEAMYRLDIGGNINAMDYNLRRNTHYNIYATITSYGAVGLYASIVPMQLYEVPVTWKPMEGLIIVSDKRADYGLNRNVWNDYSTYSGVLKVYQNDEFKDVLFKYGSVVGVSANSGFNKANDVLWHPSDALFSSINDWNTIPYEAAPGSTALSNTQVGVLSGKGDPCRLVGLSPEQISQGITDNGFWHMATTDEWSYLVDAKDRLDDTRGYGSYKYLLQPNTGARGTDGTYSAASNNGRYWSSQDKIFSFTSNPTTVDLPDNTAPAAAHSVRCVRNTVPASAFDVTTPNAGYTGTSNGGLNIAGTNIPYWKVEYVQNDGNFTFKDGIDEGAFTSKLTFITTPLPTPYTDRIITLKCTGYGFDGVIHEKTISFNQGKLQHSVNLQEAVTPALTETAAGRPAFPQGGGTYNLTMNITNLYTVPYTLEHYEFMVWRAMVEIFDESGTITLYSSTVPYNQTSVITIPANTSPAVRAVNIKPVMVAGFPPTATVANGSRNYSQKGL